MGCTALYPLPYLHCIDPNGQDEQDGLKVTRKTLVQVFAFSLQFVDQNQPTPRRQLGKPAILWSEQRSLLLPEKVWMRGSPKPLPFTK
jgi:hypothetical protein